MKCPVCNSKLVNDTDEQMDLLVCEQFYGGECGYIQVVKKEQTA